ncbi:hypothetical protein M9H77_08185 [Catharanthus roseus]|uniref:Uncharacterized protein n=1 Tax=Catharanthus roseus TaxID=4058 RepID=A0ACC0BX89_CATRO|nr:hypothetical protein M9H77_08185 [Catharanthus roseus]
MPLLPLNHLQKMGIFSTFLILTGQIITIYLPSSTSQPQQPPAITGVCNGILVSYIYTTSSQVPPTFLPSELTQQPYRFQSTLFLQNNGLEELKSWQVFVGFQHKEILVSADRAVLADGTPFPADVSNGTVFAGRFPETDLKTAVQTAGDFNKMQARIELVGTEFGVAPPTAPLPNNITLVNDGYSCSSFDTSQGINVTSVCCIKDLNAEKPSIPEEDFPPRQVGDLTIMYDVQRAYNNNYWAEVTISNHNNNSRIDSWHLSWEWMRDEFIYAMKGAYPAVVDVSECIFGSQGRYYQEMDFSTVLNCERRPTIIDLPLERTNDTELGMIPFCCRNGTILPPAVDSSKSKSVFQIQVFKMDPDLNRTAFSPPQNWMIRGASDTNYGYQCAPPVRVNPSLFLNPRGLSSEVAAIASWQVICNITRSPEKKPKCCVSFSAFFNESAIPCNTCACGCNVNPENVCNATASALLVSPDQLLIPFDNRTKLTVARAEINNRIFPNPLPCGDNCGVSINWHLLSDFEKGWTARITLFNWGETDIADWFAAVQLDKALPGLEGVYSINSTTMPESNDTLLLYGFPGLNYLNKEREGSNPKKDFRVPGSQQSIIAFTKKKTPEIKVAPGDGFPSKVFFNGEECSLPSLLPSGFGQSMTAASTSFSILLCLLVLMVLWQ